MQTGGVYKWEAFNDFMKNSKCELLTNTSGGLFVDKIVVIKVYHKK